MRRLAHNAGGAWILEAEGEAAPPAGIKFGSDYSRHPIPGQLALFAASVAAPEPTRGAIRRNVRAADLQPGDFLQGSRRTVVRVIRNGAFERSASDERTRRPWPRGKVEVVLDDGLGVRYWNARTTITVLRPANTN
jgi:hypothetical protein